MSKSITIVSAIVSFEPVAFRAPLKFGGRVVTNTDLMNTEVRIRSQDGQESIGFGSMPLGNVWGWPTQRIDEPQTAEVVRVFGRRIAFKSTSNQNWGHPIDLILELQSQFSELAEELRIEYELPEPMPKLAQLVAASSLDAAVHDSYGRLWNKNSFETLSPEYLGQDLSNYLGADFAGESLQDYINSPPASELPLYHLVGGLDPLTDDDLTKRINDGLPETLKEWIHRERITHFKIKLGGTDPQADVQRVLKTHQVVCESWGEIISAPSREISYSLDFNEGCQSVETVLFVIEQVRDQMPLAFERVQYIEQPMSRNLQDRPDFDISRAAAIKPVVIDESLTDFESFHLARKLGYSGVALKACKGQTESLLIAAMAVKAGMFLCVQDLTCPGASFLHSSALSARIPGVKAIEGNARQYCPSANKRWESRFPGMFEIKDGALKTTELNGPGLGFDPRSASSDG